MTTVRSLVTAAVIAPIVSVSAMLAAAGPAHAKASLDMPSRVTSDRKVTISGRVDLVFDAVLYVNGRQVAKGDRRVSYAWDPRRRPNGRYAIRLVERGKLLGGRWDETSRTLTQSVPPRAPGGVGVRLRGDRAVLTWSRGVEPDLRGYEIFSSRTGRVGAVGASGACRGGSCRVTLVLPAKAAGKRIGFTVRAIRSDGSGGTLVSGRSAVAAVRVPVPRARERARSAGDEGHPHDAGARQEGRNRGEDDLRSGVESLPRLPQKDTPTSRARPAETVSDGGSGSREGGDGTGPGTGDGGTGSGTGSDTVSEAAGSGAAGAGTAGKEGEGGGTGRAGSEAAETTSGGSADVTGRPEPATGGTAGLGLLIAGGMLLLLLGAHGGAWVRRRWLTGRAGGRATGGSGEGMTTTVLNAGAVPGRDGVSRGGATGAASRGGTVPDGGDTSRGGSVSGSTDTRGGAALRSDGAGEARRPATGKAPGPPRRPAVILAVVRMPYSRRPAGGPATACPVTRSFTGEGGKTPDTASPGEDGSFGVRPGEDGSSGVRPGVPVEAGQAMSAEAGRTEHAARPEESGTAAETPHARFESTGSTLPAAAPAPEIGSVTAVAVRSGRGRWDGYLPPAPRSIEDSGFWERPQPGAKDFWAEDREEDLEENERDSGAPGGSRSGRLRSRGGARS
ncbi:hypothetical protein Ppa06_51090 [Planomonospora parontospora subsp. parontospora]|uniref:Uncharacterized protein n=1 Tax=Planomonospora parontospora subsp. parontospora TaxID=97194 RepID=A0ABQ4HGT2_9ACTN|nr:hypothetical protein [Planomonospora parontospora]GII11311.1 hypothetical protein Ppa06_51090 [Planomonospora parontospora subsp. parontospora]